MTEFIEDLVAKIDGELAPINAEIERLRHAREALIKGTEPAPTRDRRPRPPANPRTRPTDSTAVIPAGTLVAAMSLSGGLSSVALAERTGGAVAQIRELLKALEQDGHVRRAGHARGLRWFAVSEQDRAAQRAAEIEDRTRQPKRERPHVAPARARRS